MSGTIPFKDDALLVLEVVMMRTLSAVLVTLSVLLLTMPVAQAGEEDLEYGPGCYFKAGPQGSGFWEEHNGLRGLQTGWTEFDGKQIPPDSRLSPAEAPFCPILS